MMQIAIVDDSAEDREELSACLENYMKKHQLDYTLTEFEDGENFLKAGKKYYVRICSYKKSCGKNIKGAYSDVKTVITKK